MADILIDNEALPSTPAASKSIIFADSTTKKLMQLDDAGIAHGNLSRNNAAASQTLGTGNTFVTNSGILIPSFGMQVGQLYRWMISLSKTAAGTAAAVIAISTGANQSTADTIQLTFTQAAAEAQSALVASAILIVLAQVRTVGVSGVLAGGFGFTQTYQATAGNLAFGGGNDAVSAGFANNALAGQYVGLQINAGASSAWTITAVAAELIG
jgi:hypothetical protein